MDKNDSDGGFVYLLGQIGGKYTICVCVYEAVFQK